MPILIELQANLHWQGVFLSKRHNLFAAAAFTIDEMNGIDRVKRSKALLG